MARFSTSEKKETPGISSGSLSDIVFMLLFFFMVTTQMRESESKVKVTVPQATEVAKLERKDLTSYINIGAPTDKNLGTSTRLELNGDFKSVDDIRDFISTERNAISPEDRHLMTVAIKADKGVQMGIITDVKQELRRCNALKIMYQANKLTEE